MIDANEFYIRLKWAHYIRVMDQLSMVVNEAIKLEDISNQITLNQIEELIKKRTSGDEGIKIDEEKVKEKLNEIPKIEKFIGKSINSIVELFSNIVNMLENVDREMQKEGEKANSKLLMKYEGKPIKIDIFRDARKLCKIYSIAEDAIEFDNIDCFYELIAHILLLENEHVMYEVKRKDKSREALVAFKKDVLELYKTCIKAQDLENILKMSECNLMLTLDNSIKALMANDINKHLTEDNLFIPVNFYMAMQKIGINKKTMLKKVDTGNVIDIYTLREFFDFHFSHQVIKDRNAGNQGCNSKTPDYGLYTVKSDEVFMRFVKSLYIDDWESYKECVNLLRDHANDLLLQIM